MLGKLPFCHFWPRGNYISRFMGLILYLILKIKMGLKLVMIGFQRLEYHPRLLLIIWFSLIALGSKITEDNNMKFQTLSLYKGYSIFMPI